MKKNRMMRLASILLVCVLLTTSVISGTFAKYTSTATGTDKARVAYWGFGLDSSIAITDLFDDSYKNVYSTDGDDVIAPGTSNFKTFKFAYTDNEKEGAKAPEVAYKFTVSTEGSSIAKAIEDNTNIQWALVKKTGEAAIPAEDSNEWGTWNQMINDIKALSGAASGEKQYLPRYAPEAFADGTEWIIAWQWKFDTSDAQNVDDTAMGNKESLDEVVIKITITATQVD